MNTSPTDLRSRFKDYLCIVDSIGLTLDISRMTFDESFLRNMEPSSAWTRVCSALSFFNVQRPTFNAQRPMNPLPSPPLEYRATE